MKIKFISLVLLCLLFTSVQAQVDRSKMPEAGPAPEVNLGSPDSFELNNGLKVLVVENHKMPHVRARLTLDNKPYSEAPEIGLKSLYSAMMGNGTKNMSKDKFNQRVDFLGASVGYGSESGYASSLTKFFPEVFGLMADGLLHPKFTEDEFQSQKDRMIEGIKSNQNNVKSIAGQVQNALTYGKNHPYGEFATVESTKRVKLSDVKSYYNNFISPKNAYLVVVGDINKRKAKKLVKKYFKDWDEQTPPSATLPEVRDVQYTQINFVDVPNAVQSEVAVINPVHLKKSSPDYFPAIIANQILGGGGDSRLFNNLREDKAYTYGAYSRLGSDKYVDRFKATASVRNNVTDSSVVAFLNEIHRIRDEKVSRQELELAKAKYTGNFVRALEKPATIAQYALSIKINDLPEDFYQDYLKKISAVTTEDVQRVAKKYFKPTKARIVIAGKGSEVAPALEEMTYKGKSIPVKYFNKDGDPVAKPDYNKAVPEGVTVKTVYDDYIQAIGGRDKVEEMNSVYMKSTGKMGPRSVTMIVKRTKDGKSLSKVMSSGMVMQKSVFDGEKGYVKIQGQKQKFSDEQVEAAKKEAGLVSELEVSEDAEITGIETVNGEDAYVVKTSENTTDYYSVESGLQLQSVTSSEQGSTTANYSNYKTVDGVKFPFTISRSFGPQSIEFNVDELKINQNVSDSDFE